MDDRRKRLKYRAWHRGFREIDLILGSFADQHMETLSDDQVEEFEKLLEVNDHDIYAWICDRAETPENFDTPLFALIKGLRYFEGTVWSGRPGAA